MHDPIMLVEADIDNKAVAFLNGQPLSKAGADAVERIRHKPFYSVRCACGAQVRRVWTMEEHRKGGVCVECMVLNEQIKRGEL